MFGSIREYTLRAGSADEIVQRVRDEFFPMISKMPGYAAYALTLVGADGLVTTSTFETQAQAEESAKAAARWVQDRLAALVTGPPRLTTGEITIREIAENVEAKYGIARRYELKTADSVELTKRVREGLVPLLKGMPGFASYGVLVEKSGDRGVTLSAFVDRATAEAANVRALAWVKENLGDIVAKPPEVIAGEIKFRHVKAMTRA